MRTPDVISLEMMDTDYWMYREALQFMTHPHPVTRDGLLKRITEQRKALAEMEQAIAEKVEVQT